MAEKLQEFYHLKGQQGLRIYTNQPTQGFTTGAAAGTGVSHTQEGGEVTGNRGSTEPTTRSGRQHCPLSEPSPDSHKAMKQVPHPGNYLRLHPTQVTGAFPTTGHATKTESKSSST